MRRLDSALLMGVGVLAVHQVAYAISATLGMEPNIGHSHMAVAWLVGSIGAVLGLAVAISRSLRSRNHSPASLKAMSFGIAAGYTALEAIERALDGIAPPDLLLEPTFWLGVVASPAIAAGLRISVRTAATIARWIGGGDGGPIWQRALPLDFRPTRVDLVPLALLSHSVSRRGPPVRRIR